MFRAAEPLRADRKAGTAAIRVYGAASLAPRFCCRSAAVNSRAAGAIREASGCEHEQRSAPFL